MASLYDILTANNRQYYRLNRQFVAKKNVPQEVLDALTPENIVDENGLVVVYQKNDDAQQPTEENTKEIADKGNKLERIDQSDNTEDKQKESENADDSENDSDAAAPNDDAEKGDEQAIEKAEEKAPEKPARAAEPVDPFRSRVPQSKPGMGFPRANGKTVDIFDGQTPHTHLKLVGGVTVPLSAESFRSKSDNQIMQRLSELGIQTTDYNEIERTQAAAASNAGNADTLLLEESESEDAASSN
jgi:Ni,Fe-hydrogenase I large subunit